MRRGRRLSGEDARLWASVARTAMPLKGKAHPKIPKEEPQDKLSPAFAAVSGRQTADTAAPVPAGAPERNGRRLTQHPIERPTRRKLARGRVAIEARIDLHEMTQDVAHDALLGFLRQAQAMGLRHVLVITGRGERPGSAFGSRGVLRRVVPLWFAGPEFRPLVSGFDSAERHHGGEGALYVRVRRFS
ncbi:Smr/MutS family protein [Aurantimonas marianensis]|uniref:Smr/MutS family protein n=1 Tax=Aurantimonas marianensis TaxID=2920428 RepID=A0A9X2HBF3_9HYPH|nr:Smr/MutS family protein [Aurantimonas marianensis]MCP3056795.1 Smr/MutS family protein [Aurantimonas marianensis]